MTDENIVEKIVNKTVEIEDLKEKLKDRKDELKELVASYRLTLTEDKQEKIDEDKK